MRERDRKKAHRDRMQIFRTQRKTDKICRQCTLPVAVDETGVPLAMCRTHLDEDAERRRDARKAARG